MEKVVKENKGKWGQVDIILYWNSAPAGDKVVTKLKDLVERYGLKAAFPPEFAKIKKPPKSKSG